MSSGCRSPEVADAGLDSPPAGSRIQAIRSSERWSVGAEGEGSAARLGSSPDSATEELDDLDITLWASVSSPPALKLGDINRTSVIGLARGFNEFRDAEGSGQRSLLEGCKVPRSTLHTGPQAGEYWNGRREQAELGVSRN